MSKTITVYSPDGKIEEHTQQNANDLTRHCGWSTTSPKVRKMEADAKAAAAGAEQKVRDDADEETRKEAEAAKKSEAEKGDAAAKKAEHVDKFSNDDAKDRAAEKAHAVKLKASSNK